MLRFHLFHFGMIHTTEYGNPEKAEDFRYLIEYSPYHNIVDGVCYPAMLFTASDTDTRVHHAHSMKMTARLQVANAGCTPSRSGWRRTSGTVGVRADHASSTSWLTSGHSYSKSWT